MFKRKIYSKMLNWKQESDGKTALLIEGARRIGKSTVVEEFAKKEYESYILIDFAKASSDVKALFDDSPALNYFDYDTEMVVKKRTWKFDSEDEEMVCILKVIFLLHEG